MIPFSRYAEICAEAYERADWEIEGVETILVTEGEVAIFAIRGTTFNFGDIIADIRSVPWWSDTLGCLCHKGFLRGAEAVWEKIGYLLVEVKGPVHFAAHSKGGPEALLLGALMAAWGRPPERIVTFGAPRPAFAGLGRWLKHTQVDRVVNGCDAVPDHPWPLWGFRHQGTLFQIGRCSSPLTRYTDHRIEGGYLGSLRGVPAGAPQ